MRQEFKNPTVAVALCSIIILLNMDMSYLKTYHKTRQNNTTISEQYTQTILPNEAAILLDRMVAHRMAAYVSAKVANSMVIESFQTPSGVDCRGSPSNRSP